MWGVGATAPIAPAERMGGGAYGMSGAGRVPVTPDSRVRSSRESIGVWCVSPGCRIGGRMLSSLGTQNEKIEDPGKEKNRKH